MPHFLKLAYSIEMILLSLYLMPKLITIISPQCMFQALSAYGVFLTCIFFYLICLKFKVFIFYNKLIYISTPK